MDSRSPKVGASKRDTAGMTVKEYYKNDKMNKWVNT